MFCSFSLLIRLREEMPKFLNWEGAQKLYASLDLLRGFSERTEFLLISASRFGRIGNTPVGKDWLSRKNGAGFFRIVTDRNDDIELCPFELIP